MSQAEKDQNSTYQGRLGRTSQTSILISSNAGPIFPASIHTSVNVTQNPELKEALEQGSIHHVPCPFDPEHSYSLAIPLRYHDEDKKVFALLLPQALRHEEFKYRSELLQELAQERDVLPDYVRNFHTVFSLAQVESLAQGSSSLPAPPAPVTPSISPAESKASQERQAQLDAVQERLDRERLRMEEVEMRIATEREELKEERNNYQTAMGELRQERQQLEALRLNLEQQQRQLASHVPDQPVEKTQVVTDDQLIEIVSDAEPPESEPLLDEHEILTERSGLLGQALSSEIAAAQSEVEATQMTQAPIPIHAQAPKTFDPSKATQQPDAYIITHPQGLVACALITPQALKELIQSRPQFFLQYRVIERYPIFTLLWGGIDDKEQLTHAKVWLIDPSTQRDEVDILAKNAAVRFAFYDANTKALLKTFDVHSPLEDNAQWSQNKADALLKKTRDVKAGFLNAKKAVLAKDADHLGSMRHNFTQNSFSSLQTLSEIKLASGIVGYWSGATFDYLIGQRSFPLSWFRNIQERVAKACYNTGIFLQEDLRDILVQDLHLAPDEMTLLSTLFANFAERCVGLKPNNLSPLQQWDNWEALFALAGLVGFEPEEEIVELAQTSLRRAQEYQQAEISMEQERTSVASSPFAPHLPSAPTLGCSSLDELVVARHSEATGVTYFLPDDAVLDKFEDLHAMSQDDLLLLLEDPNGRLEAAQVLLDRFGASVTSDVLQASEEMHTGEIAALAKFLGTHGEDLQGDLVRALDSGGLSTVYIAAYALSAQKNEDALPKLLTILDDPKRHGNYEALIKVLSAYGKSIYSPLARQIKSGGSTTYTIKLLCELSQQDSTLLDVWSKDSHKSIRQAAQKAKESLKSS